MSDTTQTVVGSVLSLWRYLWRRIDCGHTPYRSEIHPPAVMVHMRTEIHNGQPATEANI